MNRYWILHSEDYCGVQDSKVCDDIKKLSLYMLDNASMVMERLSTGLYPDLSISKEYSDGNLVSLTINAYDGCVWYRFDIEETEMIV